MTLTPVSRTAPRKSLFRIPRSLTSRLVIGVVALSFVVVAVVSLTTFARLRPFLQTRLRQQVDSIAQSTASTLQVVGYAGDYRIQPTIVTQDVWLGIYVSNTEVQSTGSPMVHPLSLNLADQSRVLASPLTAHEVTTTDGDRLQVEAVIIGPHAVLVAGLSTKDVDETLHQLGLLELLIGSVTVILAALFTAFAVRRELRPLRQVSETAEEVTAELGPDGSGLQRRVPGPEDSSEVGRVASSMNTLLAKVETEFGARLDSEERMRQFLADASHELRTPLTSIRGFAELSRLQGKVKDPDDAMHRIEIEGTRMSRLVEDLLVLARGDQDSLTAHEPVDVEMVLSEAASISRSAHPDRDISVGLLEGAQVTGDPDQLIRLFVNLLNNACVHTAAGGPIRIEALPAGIAVAVRVIDSGPGLAPEEAAHVFERFWRADKARSRVKGGSGLGMAIVAQIAATHRGQVRFESSVAHGSTVTVTLPLRPVHSGTPGSTAAPQPVRAKYPVAARQN